MGRTTLLFLLISLVSLWGTFDSACGAKIISVTFYSARSHKLTYLPLLEELGKRGHNVTVLTPIKPTKPMVNVKEILSIDGEALTKEFMEKQNINRFEMKQQGLIFNPFAMLGWYSDLCRNTYNLPQVKAILKEEFDLIFFQPLSNECALGLVHRLNAPVILFSPVGIPHDLVEKVGGYFPPSFILNMNLEFPEEMNFFERFIKFGMEFCAYVLSRLYFEPALEALYRDKLGHDIPSIRKILGNASLILSNGHFSLHRPKPLFPDVVEVGGIHCRAAKPLPEELEDFVGGAKDGLIYFSMGSIIEGSTMHEEKRVTFRNVFAKLKQRVLWKWETENMTDLPPNVKLSTWVNFYFSFGFTWDHPGMIYELCKSRIILYEFQVPQQDVLGHKNTRMFLTHTHCGGGSTEEAIYHGVPLVGFPISGDQPQNAKLAKDHGIIVELDWNEITEENLLGAIQEILNNSSYRDNVKRLSSIYRDQPDGPMDRAVYWVEYVLRHNGAVHLRSVGRKLNFFQYFSCDVIFTYLAIIATILYFLWKILKISGWIARKLCSAPPRKLLSVIVKRNKSLPFNIYKWIEINN